LTVEGLGWQSAGHFGINGPRNKLSPIIGPPFPAFKAHFSAVSGWHFPGDLIEGLFIGECS